MLAAAARERVFEGGRQPAFDSISVLEKLGGPIGPTMDFTAPSSMADFERAAVETALAPLRVHWSAAVAMPVPSLAFAVPLVIGDQATVVTQFRCGPGCDRLGIVELKRVDGAWRR